MKKDPTEFRERFKRWKAGEKVYEAGLTLSEPVITPDSQYNEFLNTLPDNQRLTPNYAYDTRRYWELNGKPKNFGEAVEKGMYSFEKDGAWHAHSVQETPSGNIEFMKPKTHSTVSYETGWYDRLPEDSKFKQDYELTDDPNRPNFYMYKKRILPAYDGGETPSNSEDERTYIAAPSVEIGVKGNGEPFIEHATPLDPNIKYLIDKGDGSYATGVPMLNWQDYWGNVGAGAVNKAQEEAFPYVLNGMSMLAGNPISSLAGIGASIVGEDIGANFGPFGAAVGGLIGGIVFDPTNIINARNIVNDIRYLSGHTFSRNIPILNNLYYRRLTNTAKDFAKDAINDANNIGIVRSNPKGTLLENGKRVQFLGPYFQKGLIFGHLDKGDIVITSKPTNSLDWFGIKPHEQNLIREKDAILFTPLYSGASNAAPTSNFTYWQRGNGPISKHFWVNNEFILNTATLRNADYVHAVMNGNYAKAYRLRREHFLEAAPNTKIMSNGDPVMLFHGTPNDGWHEYDESKFGTTTDEGWYGRGMYLSESFDKAAPYSFGYLGDPRFMKRLFANSERPFISGMLGKNFNNVTPNEASDRGLLSPMFNRQNFKISLDLIQDPENFLKLLTELNNSDASVFTQIHNIDKLPTMFPFEEVVIPKSNQMKYADPVTYTDDLNPILLWLRDDFSNPDFRYDKGKPIRPKK